MQEYKKGPPEEKRKMSTLVTGKRGKEIEKKKSRVLSHLSVFQKIQTIQPSRSSNSSQVTNYRIHIGK